MLTHDADSTGQISAPTLSIHAIHDAVASISLEAEYSRVVASAGRSDLLAQFAVEWDDYSRLPDGVLAAALTALDDWSRGGRRPDADTIAAWCAGMA